MHVGGAWAKWVVRGEDPLTAGQGVTPVRLAPAATGGGAGGEPGAWVVGVGATVTTVVGAPVVVAAAAGAFLLGPVVWTTIRAMIPTIRTMAPPTTMNLRRLARRCWAARSCIARAAAFSR